MKRLLLHIAHAALTPLIGFVPAKVSAWHTQVGFDLDVGYDTRRAKWISWYLAPLRDTIEYLALAPDHEPGEVGGFIYVRDINAAHRFDDREAALLATPCYDGSNGIESRSGIRKVRA